ncbi:MAG: hypothetical protein N2110_05670 [Flavobacteriales bacterium]|nr:hypothetical protein [Flavobacteriales bacterium]MCX7768491.1 hypothetical protein [Flavobacteriales bacterium]MDW8409824.1 hypothetical protein [Flavobacteriales bacterium]
MTTPIRMRSLIAGILLAPALIPSWSQTLRTLYSRDSILLGEQVLVTYELSIPGGIRVLLPSEKMICPEPLESVGSVDLDTSQREGNTLISLKLRITAFDSGSFAVPSVPFFLIDPKGDTAMLLSDSFKLHVNTVPVDTTLAFRDIKGPLEPPRDWREYLLYFLGLLCVLLLGGTAWWWYRRRKNRKRVVPEKVLTPAEQALQALETLAAEQLWQKGQEKLYYVRLTEILRTFFQAHFKFPAPEMVSEEILQALRMQGVEASFLQRFRELFTSADMTKFAKGRPLAAENEAAMTTALDFVKLYLTPAPTQGEKSAP